MSKYRKVASGDEFHFPAALYNDLVDVVSHAPLTRHKPPHRARAGGPLVLHARNATGVTLDIYTCVALSGDSTLIAAHADDGVVPHEPLEISGVASAGDEYRAGIVLEKIPVNDVGPVLVRGTLTMPVMIDQRYDSTVSYRRCEIDAGLLRPSAAGAIRLLSLSAVSAGAGAVWGTVRLGDDPDVVVVELTSGEPDADGLYDAQELRYSSATGTFQAVREIKLLLLEEQAP